MSVGNEMLRHCVKRYVGMDAAHISIFNDFYPKQLKRRVGFSFAQKNSYCYYSCSVDKTLLRMCGTCMCECLSYLVAVMEFCYVSQG